MIARLDDADDALWMSLGNPVVKFSEETEELIASAHEVLIDLMAQLEEIELKKSE